MDQGRPLDMVAALDGGMGYSTMAMYRYGRLSGLLVATGVTVLLASVPAFAAGTPAIEEVVVTAQKQEQPADTVGMSITVATGASLRQRGIDTTDDLTRLVSGLTIEHSAFNSTSVTLRGVGFFNSDLATPAAVTVYVDEAPLVYPAMTQLAAFDLARVEILKGPQGTLFGENATGGAVNFIAAKPTDAFSQGLDITYGNFNRLRLGGFVSGPITDRLSARLAFRTSRGDGWQQSVSRPGDTLGRISTQQARLTLDWRATESLESLLTLTFTHDGSDSEAAQFIKPVVTIPALANPGVVSFPIVTTPRAADWAPVLAGTNRPFPYASDTDLYHLSWRNNLAVGDGITLTSVTSIALFRMNYGQDPDGLPFHMSENIDRGGRVDSYFQELRATGQTGKLSWLVGANVEHEATRDNPVAYNTDNSASHIFLTLDPLAIADSTQYTSRLRALTFGIFGRAEYRFSDQLSLEGALRYNRDDRTFDNCAIATTDGFVRFWNLFLGSNSTAIGKCYVLDAQQMPVANVHSTLDQDSVSWRVGVNWTPRPGLLVYANISKGYKAGAVPVLAAAEVSQFKVVPQESLLAYETGVKASLFDRRLELNGAVFYYDYSDKQLRGAELDPNFGPLQALVSIPKSHVVGAEAQVTARPFDGLTLDAEATYIDTNIDRFTGFDALARFGNQSGTPFPFSPKWSVAVAADYERPLTAEVDGFVGGSFTYNSQTNAGLGEVDLLRIKSYSLLDLRAGITFQGGRCRLWVWGKNVADTYYWNNVFVAGDSASRFVGEPATYGVSFSERI